MFKLFKKIKTANAVEVITAIHNEFDIAGENLLREAKEILASDIDTGKGERLNKLGFGSSRAAVDAKTVADIKTKSKEIAERVGYFKTYYPNYKFITEEMVEAICKKYGLLCGSASVYTGDVPEKNVREIETFNLRDEDCVKIEYGWHKQDPTSGYYFHYPSKTENCIYGYILMNRRFGFMFTRITDATLTHHYDKPEFKICAPVKDFDTSMMRIKDGYSLQDIPDPIVLQPVKGGYLIVSKWGLEASDPSLVNEIQN